MFVSVLLLQNLFVCGHAVRLDAGSLQTAMDTDGSFTMNLTGAETNVDSKTLVKDSVGAQNRSTYWSRQWPSSWGSYVHEERELGRGAYGIVKEVSVTCPDANQATRLAVKQMGIKTKKHRRNATNEEAALESMRKHFAERQSGEEDLSPFIVAPVVPPTWTTDYVYFVTPLYEIPGREPSSLEPIVDDPNVAEEFGGNPAKFGFLLHAAKGLEAMHKANMAHLDVKPSNVMVSCVDYSRALGKCHASIIDLGISLEIGAKAGVRGTPEYMAPEVYGGRPAAKSSDVWSFGIMVWEMFYGFESLPSGKIANYTKLRRSRIVANKIAGGWVQGLIKKLPPCEFENCEDVKELLSKSLVTGTGSRLKMNDIIDLLKPIAPPSMQGSFPTPSVKTATCLAPRPSCCYKTGVAGLGQKTYKMVGYRETCESPYKKFQCPPGNCDSCWDECCKKRHPLRRGKCTGPRAIGKKREQCNKLVGIFNPMV